MVFGTPTTGSAEVRVHPRGHAERVLAADRDQRVELLEARLHPLDAAVHLVGFVRLVPMIVPPRGRIPEISGRPSGWNSRSTMPRHPSRTPTTSSPRCHERRATARITAFRPGQSPPPVRTPMRMSGRVYVCSAKRRPTASWVPYSPFVFAYAWYTTVSPTPRSSRVNASVCSGRNQ